MTDTVGFTNTGVMSASSLTIDAEARRLDASEQRLHHRVTGGPHPPRISGAARLDNEGTISAAGGARLTLDLSGANNGTISAGPGGWIVIAGGLSGTGALTVGDGAIIEIAGSGATVSNGVTFAAGGVGTLRLDSGSSFTGTVSGLAPGDAIDFAGESVTAATLSGATLTVATSGGSTQTLTLAAPLAAGLSVQTRSDGAGGTERRRQRAPCPP